MNNYEFCASYIEASTSPGAVILDYGCGSGTIIRLLQARQRTALGCDVFYEGGDYSSVILPQELGTTIFRMDADRIPFPDNYFDFIVSNQVLEHVPDLDVTIEEMARVLKPGGTVLSVFPYKGVWREGHCGVPFLHWFPRGSRVRLYYAYLARCCGLGFHTKGKSKWEWAQDFCDWLDRWTHYRTYNEIRHAFRARLSEPQHLEQVYLSARLGSPVRFLPSPVLKFITWRLGSLVFTSTKPATSTLPLTPHCIELRRG